eukprot:TRINITY_DN816_c0_g1_i3.p1 TRINITY_DN816_c0_g1~~TRINITY_DN816_c0_g1_i3.p1  ORF type:complete len:1383 (+),score=561.46 TRINITY_DN816_c0_g1_i3:76-4224(+)
MDDDEREKRRKEREARLKALADEEAAADAERTRKREERRLAREAETARLEEEMRKHEEERRARREKMYSTSTTSLPIPAATSSPSSSTPTQPDDGMDEIEKRRLERKQRMDLIRQQQEEELARLEQDRLRREEERRIAKEERLKALAEEEKKLEEERQKRRDNLQRKLSSVVLTTEPVTPAPASTTTPSSSTTSTSDTDERERRREERRKKEEEDERREKEEREKREEERRKKREAREQEEREQEEREKQERERKRKAREDKEKEDELREKEERDRRTRERQEREEREKKEREDADQKRKDEVERKKKEKEEQDESERKREKKNQEKSKRDVAEKEAALKREKDEMEEKKKREMEEKKRKEEETKEHEEKERKEKELEKDREKEKKLREEKETQEREAKEKKEREDRVKKEQEDQDIKDAKDAERVSKPEEQASVDEDKDVKEEEDEEDKSGNPRSSVRLQSLTLNRVKQTTRRKRPTSMRVAKSDSSSSSASSSARPAPSEDEGVSLLSIASRALKEKAEAEEANRPKLGTLAPPSVLGGMAALAMEAQKKRASLAVGSLSKSTGQDTSPAKPTSPMGGRSFLNTSTPSPSSGRSFLGVSPSNLSRSDPASPITPTGRDRRATVSMGSNFSPLSSPDSSPRFIRSSIRSSLSTMAEQVARKRLIHCKGKKRILIREVEIAPTSLNNADVFVLDTGGNNSTIYCWMGPKSTAAKKSKGVAVAEILKNHEHAGHATIKKIDQFDDDPEFWKELGGGSKDAVASAEDAGDDTEVERTWVESWKLYTVAINMDGGGDGVDIIPAEVKQLNMATLLPDSYHLLDCGLEVYMWYGKGSDINARGPVFMKGEEWLKEQARPSWVALTRVAEGGEPLLFREKFSDWPDLSHEKNIAKMGLGGKRNFEVYVPYERKSPLKLTSFNTSEIVAYQPPEEEIKSDGSGTLLHVWLVEGFTRAEVPREQYGHFYSGSCYLIEYEYTTRSLALKYMLFIWQGYDAKKNDEGSSALQANDMWKEISIKGEAYQDLNHEGRESHHFLEVFRNKLIIHKGDHSIKTGCTSMPANVEKEMYHVKDDKVPARAHAVQVSPPSGTALNSRDAFLIKTAEKVYVWEGKGAKDKLIDVAEGLAELIAGDRKVVPIEEGAEPSLFWKVLEKPEEYADPSYLANKSLSFPRFFAVASTGTIIRADELFDFSQHDLDCLKVAILDTRQEVYVWAGARSQEKEKKRAMEIALEYVELLADGRKPSETVFMILQKEEPLAFLCHFHGWDEDKNRTLPLGVTMPTKPGTPGTPGSPVANLAKAAASPSDSPRARASSMIGAGAALQKYRQVVPLEVLKGRDTPPEVDRAVLEEYLSEEEFLKAFGIPKKEWASVPAWKKITMKKTAGLF